MEDSINGGYPNSWMVYNRKSYLDIFRWMIWGYSHFGNPPYTLAAINNYLLGMVGIPHPTHKNGDDLGMVYGIGFTTFWGKQTDGGID